MVCIYWNLSNTTIMHVKLPQDRSLPRRYVSSILFANYTQVLLEGFLFKLYKIHIVACHVVSYFKHYSIFSVGNTHFIIYTIFWQLIKNIKFTMRYIERVNHFKFVIINYVRLASIWLQKLKKGFVQNTLLTAHNWGMY